VGTSNEKMKATLNYLRKNVPTAWRGHEDFAIWLVKELKPKVIVELGTEFGFSTFVFAAPKIGTVYGIDWFKGDEFTGIPDTKKMFMDFKKEVSKRFGINNIKVIEGRFTDVVKKWNKPIDILHIDGSHRYEDVKEDYKNWSKFVKKDGIILLHDVHVPQDQRFGVGRFFDEIDPPKLKFFHSFGLGVVSKDENIIKKIAKKYKNA